MDISAILGNPYIVAAGVAFAAWWVTDNLRPSFMFEEDLQTPKHRLLTPITVGLTAALVTMYMRKENLGVYRPLSPMSHLGMAIR